MMRNDDYIVIFGCIIFAFFVGIIGGYVLRDVFSII